MVNSGTYGKALILDGKWQSSQADEFLYHEPLVHPACALIGGPRTALVLGGGEGATIREVLRWQTIEQVVMVDIDAAVVEVCRKHLPEMHQGAFEDPRTELVIADAFDYVTAYENHWDVIISDLPDPLEEGPAFKLFTREYFERCRRALTRRGCFVMQAGVTAPPEMAIHVRLVNTVKAVFSHSCHYISQVPTWASPMGFALGSQSAFHLPDPPALDAMLAQKTSGGLRMLDGASLNALMHPPKYLRDAVAAETQVYSLAAPPKAK